QQPERADEEAFANDHSQAVGRPTEVDVVELFAALPPEEKRCLLQALAHDKRIARYVVYNSDWGRKISILGAFSWRSSIGRSAPTGPGPDANQKTRTWLRRSPVLGRVKVGAKLRCTSWRMNFR